MAKKGSFASKKASIAKKYEQKGYSAARANKIAGGGLANRARNASLAAKRKNKNLSKVKG